jgi:AraC-like DNA-binding protein
MVRRLQRRRFVMESPNASVWSLPSSDPSAHRVDPGEELLARTRAKLRTELERGAPTLEEVARFVGFTERTFQRRMTELGSSFHELLEEVRREVAIRCVRDRAIALDAVPASLGYAQKETFWRAFKRWTGTTPLRFRREHGLPHGFGVPG